jgi:SSS family solute:Na+ symporter
MKFTFLILIFGITSLLYVYGRGKPHIEFTVKKAGELPGNFRGTKNPGVAGAFSGIVANHLVVAGGANFPDKASWKGGMKVYHDQIYVFQINGDSLTLVDAHQKLAEPVAYGASVSLADGVLCIGGSNAEACSRKVFLMKCNDRSSKINFEDFPSLPGPLSFMSAVLMEDQVYVVGGSSSPDGTDTGNYFYRLDLSKRHTSSFGWETLPAFPGPGRIFAPAVAQSNGVRPCIYLFSGRNLSKAKGLTVFQDGMLYDPVLQRWSKVLAANSVQFPVMAGTAFPVGASSIAFLGGASEKGFSKEHELKKHISEAISLRDTSGIAQAKKDLLTFYNTHPGFSKKILLYNTITGSLSVAWKYEYVFPVTSNLSPWNGGVFLSNGEVKPGVRTPEILLIRPENQSFSFGWLNSAVLFLYFLVLILIGYIFSRKQKSTDDYFKGGGRVPWWAAGLSLFGTALSAITFMAIPAKTYATDWSYFVFNMSIFLVAPIIIVLFIPFYRRLNITTAYEYLEKRFNLTVRLLGSVSFILYQIGRMGIVLLLPSLALNVVTGMNVFACILLMGMISLLYTLMGGIEAVIWTDVIQVVILLVGALVAVVLMMGTIDGGFQKAFHEAAANHKFNLLDLRMTLREPTVWVMLIGGLFTNVTTYGTDQTMVQRYLTTQNEKEARQSVWTNAWLSVPATLLFFSIGTALFVFYRNYPNQYNPSLENIDSIFPWYIASQLPNGLSGLLIAGIFAAAMSSLSSSMNSGATVYSTDIHFRFGLTLKVTELKIARITTFIIGLAGTLFALFMATSNIQSLWDEFQKIIGLIIGSLGGLFLLGILTKKANGAGALIGIIISVFVQVLVNGSQAVHLLMYTATGVVSCFAFGWLGSLFFPDHHKSIDGLTIYTINTSLSRH